MLCTCRMVDGARPWSRRRLRISIDLLTRQAAGSRAQGARRGSRQPWSQLPRSQAEESERQGVAAVDLPQRLGDTGRSARRNTLITRLRIVASARARTRIRPWTRPRPSWRREPGILSYH